jgi:hypothetical protein
MYITMYDLSWPPIACRRIHVIFMLYMYVFVCA